MTTAEPTGQIRIRLMTVADLPFIMQLKREAGWNQTERDIRRCLALAPEGCFVAEFDGQPAGTAAALIMGPVAWIAMVLVDPRLRRRGIGEALMRRALQTVETRQIATARLDATPMGQGIYERLGFVTESVIARHSGVLAPLPGPAIEERLRAYAASDLEAVADLDRAATGMDRRALFAHLLADRPEAASVAVRNGRLVGFALARDGEHATQIGPCVATDADAGRALLVRALRRHAGRSVFVDVPVANTDGTRLAASAGLTVQRHLTRMVRGLPIPDRPEFIWSTFGPEKG